MLPLCKELRALWKLALPTVLTQFGQMLYGIVDTMMLGRVGVAPMAAAALGSAYAWVFMMIATGIVLGVDPLISQAHGRGNRREIALSLQRALLIAACVSLPVLLAYLYASEVLCWLGQDRELARLAGVYLRAQCWSVPTFPLIMALRSYLLGRAIVKPFMWITVAANLWNVLFDWLLIFGHWGIPALGLVGAGIATGLTRCSVLLVTCCVIVRAKLYVGAWQPWSRASFAPAGLWHIVKLGLPIGAQLGLEVNCFTLAALMAGRMGEGALTAHDICLNIASLSFMLPLGVSLTAASRVGNLLGEGAEAQLRSAGKLAIALGTAVMLVNALLIFGLRSFIPRAFVQDLAVVELAAALLPIVATLQVADGAQVVSAGVLRGLGHTRAPAVIHFIGYYLVALPLAYVLAFRAGLGVQGVWWGLTLGLLSIAGLLLFWVTRALRLPVLRLSNVER
jgi:MATE family multidrug resistance protein